MYIPLKSFHAPFTLSARFTVNQKPAAAYGLNWFEVVGDDERDVVALMARVPSGEAIPKVYLHTQDGEKLAVFVSDDWPVNLVISANEMTLPLCDLHLIACNDEAAAVAHTRKIMEVVTKELLRDALLKAESPEPQDAYIDNNWQRHLQAMIDQGEVSHVEAQIMEGNLPEGFTNLALTAA